MNRSSQQKRLDWGEHGMNCSDPHCVLSVCINWKVFGQAIARQNDRQINGHTRVDPRRKDASQLKSGPLPGQDNDEQFLQFLREVQEIDQIPSNFSEWTKVPRKQQVSQAASHGPMNTSWLPQNTLQTDKKSPAFKVRPDKIIPNFDLEQFISIDPYVNSPEKKEVMKNKCTQNDCAGISTEFPVGPSAFRERETVCSLGESKEQLQGIQSKGINKIFGILSEILHVLEAPMSAELEAFCIQVLQKAHEEIQRKANKEIQTESRFKSFSTKRTWDASEWDILSHQ